MKLKDEKESNKLHRTIDEDRKLAIQVRFDAILFFY